MIILSRKTHGLLGTTILGNPPYDHFAGAWKFSAFSTSCWRLLGSWRTQQDEKLVKFDENPVSADFSETKTNSFTTFEVKMMKKKCKSNGT